MRGERWIRQHSTAVTLLWIGACGESNRASDGNETHIVQCKTDTDCNALGPQASCQARICTTVDGSRATAGVDASHGVDASLEVDASLGTEEDGGGEAPPPFVEPVAARCAVPAPPVGSYDPDACSDQAGAPGAKACYPSAATEFGRRCCVRSEGACGHDFGNGCTSLTLERPGETADAPPACSVPTEAIATVHTGPVELAMNGTYVFTVERASRSYTVRSFNKADCTTTVLHEAAGYGRHLAATEDAVYWVEGQSLLSLPAGGGNVAEVDLPAAVGPPPNPVGGISSIASRGRDLYVFVTYQPTISGRYGSGAIVHLPCCGAAPNIFVAYSNPIDALSVYGAFPDTDGVFWLRYVATALEAGYLTLDFVDFSSGQSSRILVEGRVLTVHDGAVYLDSTAGAILRLDPDTCRTTSVVSDRLFDSVGATVRESAIYWVEWYTDISTSRIFARSFGSGATVQLVETSRPVAWLGADAEHLYWYEPATTSLPNQLLRVGLPRL